MEEKKTKNKAEIKAINSVKEEKDNKLTYDQLNDVCMQLYQQNQQLTKQLQQVNVANMFRRLDYLFKVVEFADTIKDSDFVNTCIEEIKEALTVPESEEGDNSGN